MSLFGQWTFSYGYTGVATVFFVVILEIVDAMFFFIPWLWPGRGIPGIILQ